MSMLRTTLSCLLLLTALAPLSRADDESKEPALGYTLVLDGQKVRLEPGKEVAINGVFSNPKAKLVPDAERHFEYAGLQFDYPAYFAFEADFSTPGVRIWTLSGIDFMIMVFNFEEADITSRMLAEMLTAQYGKGSRIEEVSHSINGKDYAALRVHINFADIKLFQDVLALESETGALFLILQDFPKEVKTSEAETKQVFELLNNTFKQD